LSDDRHKNTSGSKILKAVKKNEGKQFAQHTSVLNVCVRDLHFASALEAELRARGFSKVDLIKALIEKQLIRTLHKDDLSPDQLAKTIGASVQWFKATSKHESGTAGVGEIDNDLYEEALRNVVAHIETIISSDSVTHKKVLELIKKSKTKSKDNVIDVEVNKVVGVIHDAYTI